MEELILRWEGRAKKAEKSGRESTMNLMSERYFAEAQTLKVCADELRRALQSGGGNHDTKTT